MRLKLLQPNYTPFTPKDKLQLWISFLFYVALTFFLLICTVCTYHSCRINSITHECCKVMQDSHLLMKNPGIIGVSRADFAPKCFSHCEDFSFWFKWELQSCQFGLKGQSMHPITSPTILQRAEREREREKNEYARTAAGDDELYFRYADNLPEYGAYGSCFSRSSVFHNVLCMFVAS